MLPASSALHCSELRFGSKLQVASLALRDRILRQPLLLSYDPADLREEHRDMHLALHAGNELYAVLLLRQVHPQDNSVLKMRQVAVDVAIQGRGYGRMLVDGATRFAREKGCTRIELHARAQAVPFYQKLGYAAEGDWFDEVGIPHLFMFKEL
jgi:predicted GNAT family N-acyltransferase